MVQVLAYMGKDSFQTGSKVFFWVCVWNTWVLKLASILQNGSLFPLESIAAKFFADSTEDSD